MAKKPSKQKVNKKEVGKKMNAGEIKKWSKDLADIGSGRQHGLVIIIKIDRTEEGVNMSGPVFAHKVSKREALSVIGNLVKQFDVNPLEMMTASLGV